MLDVNLHFLGHANDHLDKEQMLGASGKLVLLYGLGAMAGPSLAGVFMQRLGTSGFMTYMAVIYVIMALHALWRRTQRPEALKATPAELMRVGPVSTPVAAQALAQGEGGRAAG